jgi:hypothetical protein
MQPSGRGGPALRSGVTFQEAGQSLGSTTSIDEPQRSVSSGGQMRPYHHTLALAAILVASSLAMLVAACADRMEPPPSPIVARRLGGDSMLYGAVTHVCRADDVGCVPVMAVACKSIWVGGSSGAAAATACRRGVV